MASLIDGRLRIGVGWEAGEGREWESVDPFRQEAVWRGRWASDSQCDRAIEQARQAFKSWSQTTLADRIAIVKRFAEQIQSQRSELNRWITSETGKPLWESDTETSAVIGKVQNSIESIQHRRWTVSEGEGNSSSVIRYRPLGVMVVLGPFNLPAHLPGAHIVPALLAGNTIVLKPSERTPGVGEFLVRAWQSAGLPDGVLNLVHGAAEVSQRLVQSTEIDGVLFTGSYRVGRLLHQALAGRPEVMLALEMGGNNALVIESVRDIDAAVYQILLSAYITSGQRCTCARRLIWTEDGNGGEVVRRLAESIPRIRVGDPSASPGPFMGCLISKEAAQSMLQHQGDLIARGVEAIHPMETFASSPAMLGPGLLQASPEQLPDEEWFGPLLVAQPARDLDHAIEMANASRFGLSAGLISDNVDSFHYFVQRIRAGIVNWNRQTTGASGKLPFGGIGASGNHRPSGSFAADYCSFPVASLESTEMPLPSSPNVGLEEVVQAMRSRS